MHEMLQVVLPDAYSNLTDDDDDNDDAELPDLYQPVSMKNI